MRNPHAFKEILSLGPCKKLLQIIDVDCTVYTHVNGG